MTETDVISPDAAPDTSSPDSPSAAAPERRRRGGVSGMVIAELRDLAAELGVPDTSGMRRGDLISEIKKRQSAIGNGAPQLPLGDDVADTPAAEAEAPASASAPASRRRATRRTPTAVPDTAPADTAPADTAPADTAPADTAPTDTAPAEARGNDGPAATDVTATTDALPASAAAAVNATTAPEDAVTSASEADAPAATGTPAASEAPSAPSSRGRGRRGARRDGGSPPAADSPAADSPAADSPAADSPAADSTGTESAGTDSTEASAVTVDTPFEDTGRRPASSNGTSPDTATAASGDTSTGGRRGQDEDTDGREGGGRSRRERQRDRSDGQGSKDQPAAAKDQDGSGNNRDGRDNRDDRKQQPSQQQPSQQQQSRDDDDDEDGGGRRRGRRFRDRRRNRNERGQGQGQGQGPGPNDTEVRDDDVLIPVAGILDILDNYAFVRTSGYMSGPNDVYVSLSLVRRHGLRRGDAITGQVRQQRENEQSRQKFNPLVRVDSINGLDPEQSKRRAEFTKLTPLYPNERLRLETEPHLLTTRVIDLVMPVGKGQRALIVSPPKAGKTMVMQAIANAITTNNPEVHLMVVLVDERPEEVTDMQRTVKGEVIASTFDRPPSDHTTVSELAIERAKRLVEMGHDVVVLLDSITRLGRAYNLAAPASGRILSGGVDSTALYPPKRFLGAARNIEDGGSLTIFATALVETGSTMDTVIFEEFKGTGNAELKLDRKLSDKRIFPSIDADASSTRKEELLLSPDETAVMHRLRRVISALDSQQAIELVLDRLRKTRTNIEFLMQVAKTTPGVD